MRHATIRRRIIDGSSLMVTAEDVVLVQVVVDTASHHKSNSQFASVVNFYQTVICKCRIYVNVSALILVYQDCVQKNQQT